MFTSKAVPFEVFRKSQPGDSPDNNCVLLSEGAPRGGLAAFGASALVSLTPSALVLGC